MNKDIQAYLANQKIAILVIDMQNDFLLDGAPIHCPGCVDIMPHVNNLMSLARNKNIPVIFTQEAHRADKIDFGLELQGDEPEHCLEGTKGVEFIDSLDIQPSDYIIVKRRYSAFFATDLDILLRGLGTELLILAGVTTDVCVRATAQDAQQFNYRVVVPKECVAGTRDDRHESALENIRYLYGRVCDLNDIVEYFKTL